MNDVERLLSTALAPVEPPVTLTDRLEWRLTEITDAAADELADWERGAMRDPRNWGRSVAAATVMGIAGGALVIVRARQQHQRARGPRGLAALQKSVREVAGELRGQILRRRAHIRFRRGG